MVYLVFFFLVELILVWSVVLLIFFDRSKKIIMEEKNFNVFK